MLMLRRKPGEAVVTSNGIRVDVLEIRGDRVSLGFSAGADVIIWRDELLTRSTAICLTCFKDPCDCPAVAYDP